MSEERKLTAGELGAIASALGVSAATLLGEPEPARPLAIAARLGRAGHTAELSRPFERAEELLKLRGLLDQIFTRPDSEPAPYLARPTTTHFGRAGAALATRLREALGLGTRPVPDLESLALRFGLDVATESMPSKLHGLLVVGSAGSSPVAMALLNLGDSLGRRRFTLAHELGHLLFDDAELYIADYVSSAAEKPSGPAGLVEFRADCFAAQLLAPEQGVRDLASALGQIGDREAWTAKLVGGVASRFGISVESALVRTEDLDLITHEERSVLEGWSATRVLRSAGVSDLSLVELGSEVVPPIAILTQALHAYQEGMLGLKPLATLYDTTDLEALVASLSEAGWSPAYKHRVNDLQAP
jgi:Zn-dependent peptidase ImmA (M78 family)